MASPRTLQSICALDLGSSKFTLGFLKVSQLDKKSEVTTTVQFSECPAQGIKKGALTDFATAEQTLLQLIQQAEQEFNTDISQVVIAIGGHHLDSFHDIAELELKTHFVEPKHNDALLQQVKTKIRRPDKELLQVIPTYYQLDQRKHIVNPIGLSGHYLRAEFLTVWADKAYLSDVIRLCNQCGLQVTGAYGEPFAMVKTIDLPEARQLSAALIDLGAGKTTGIVEYHNFPEKIIFSGLGGGLISQDLALAFNLSIEEAERLKVQVGLRPPQDTTDLHVLSIGGEEKQLTWRDVIEIIDARMNELARHLALNLISHKGRLGGGIILTGGGSALSGIDEFLAGILKIPVLRQHPHLSIGSFSKTFSSKYATVIGLIKLEAEKQERLHEKIPTSTFGRLSYQLTHWIKELS